MPKLIEVFYPKKGDKFWMMFEGKPVEATEKENLYERRSEIQSG